MSNFTSTLDLPNLSGFDTGVPTNSSNSTHSLLKLLLIAVCVFGLFYWFYSLVQKEEDDISEKMKLLQ